MHLKIVAEVESREEYESIIIAYENHNEVSIVRNGQYQVIVAADGTLDELMELVNLMPYFQVRTICLNGGG